jgi:hypothetical protein
MEQVTGAPEVSALHSSTRAKKSKNLYEFLVFRNSDASALR